MLLTSLLTPETRVLDFGVTSPALGQALAEDGFTRYLGLVPPKQLDSVRSRAGEMAGRFHALTSPEQAVRSSSDLLILRPAYVGQLWLVHDLRHVRYIAVESGWSKSAVEARLAGLAGRLIRDAKPRGHYSYGASRFDVFKIVRPAPSKTRRYLSPVWGVPGLIERLDAAGLRYAVLRWFESLPAMEPGEDLDVLVADTDLAAFEELLSEEPGIIPVDLYSETGLPSSDYKGMAYYPPDLARQLLDQAVVHSSGARVPEPTDHLRSLAYHAVYRKGARSGLPSAVLDQQVTNPEHDYATVLQQLAHEVGVDLPRSLDGVDEYLSGEGWRPSLDTLLRLTVSNPWLERRFFPDEEIVLDPPEPVVFLLRERLASVVGAEEVLAMFDHLGFEIVLTHDLDADARARCAAQTRGGNWGRGPFPLSGGQPVTAVVALHYAPKLPEGAVRKKYPRLSNLDVLLAKQKLRDMVAARVDTSEQFNPVHSSDNEREAWEYISLAVPDEHVRVRAEVAQRRAEYSTDIPVLKQLSRGRRAKVEVVDGPDGWLVRKTFAAGYLRHMDRELLALRELAPHVPAIPRLVESGPNWFTCPYYENSLAKAQRSHKLLPLPVVREMVSVLREIHRLGYDLIDAKTQNFLLDPSQGLKIVDFEFLHRYDEQRPAFAASYTFDGVPTDFFGDVPVGDFSYERRWRRATGLSLHQLTAGSVVSQHAHRMVFRVERAARGSVRRILVLLRTWARAARPTVVRRFRGWANRRTEGGA